MDSVSSSVTDQQFTTKELSPLEPAQLEKLAQQARRSVSEFNANKLEKDAKKNWDLFYKRNGNRFFRDRHWTKREFADLAGNFQTMLEIGCGVGNLIFPLLEDLPDGKFLYACDFSTRAVDLVRSNPLYEEKKVKAFVCDVTSEALSITVPQLDLATCVFVLSAVHPDKFLAFLRNVHSALKPSGGTFLFRDYGRYDVAQLRFGPNTLIQENLYARQDGTRAYYFTVEEVQSLLREAGFTVANEDVVYVHRRTVNRKEGIDVGRTFVQAKATA